MSRDEIIRMAREAEIFANPWAENDASWPVDVHDLQRFAALVAAHEREARIKAQEQVAELQARIARADVELQRAVIAEREECAKVCEQSDSEGEGPDCWGWHAKHYAAAIRARGTP